MPESRRIHRIVKAEDLFDTTVAVGGDDKVLPRQAWLGVRDSDQHVVMELALLVVDEEIIGTPVLADALEERITYLRSAAGTRATA